MTLRLAADLRSGDAAQEGGGALPAGAAKARVLIVSPQPFYEDRGTPIAVSQLAAALSALGYEVDLLAYPLGTPVQLPGLRILRGANFLGLRRARIGFSFGKLVLDAGMLGKLWSLLRSQPYGAVHALEEMAWPVIVLCRRRGIPVIYDMQSSLPDQLRTHAFFRLAWVQRRLHALETWALRRANAIICAAGLLDHVKSRAPGTVCYEWHWPGQAGSPSEDAAALRARLGIAPDRKVVLYAGTFEPYQGISTFLEALASVTASAPESVGVLVGATQDSDLGDDAPASRLVRDGKLKILPRQPRHDISSYLAMADILVSPRAYGDNVPLKVFDYVLSGKPIVATDIVAHRSILGEQTAMLVGNDAAGIAGGILRLLRNPAIGTRIAAAARARASAAPGKQAYIGLVETLYATTLNPGMQAACEWTRVSVVVPARNEALIGRVVEAVRGQRARVLDIEVIVVDDGSTDDTAERAKVAGARVICMRTAGEPGNPAAARNRGAAESRGDPVVFLDADCIVADGWLERILKAHEQGAAAVGGSLSLPPGLPAIARCDYYCGWYVIHPAAAAGWVPHHPPPNLSVRRAVFTATRGFAEHAPFCFTNEERFWQRELRDAGHRIYFEPSAVAAHYNRPGFANLLRRNYRWGYTAVEAKSQTGSARAAWLYRHPWLLVLGSPVLVIAHSAYIVACWLRAGVFEILLMLPLVLVSRIAYMAGLCVGAVRWLGSRRDPGNAARPRPRWE